MIKVVVLWIILAFLALLLLIALCLLFTKTRVYISYKEDKLKIKFQNGLFWYTIKPKAMAKKVAPTRENIEKEVEKSQKKLSGKASFLWKLLKNMRWRVEVKKIKIKVTYGTGDPADTGILYGIIWAAIGNLYQLFNQYLVFDFPEAEIMPDFENKVFETEFFGIIKLKLVHIISALYKSYKN